MDKPEITLTEDEWNKLSTAGIEPETFDDYSFQDIQTALQPDAAREKQLRAMFFSESTSPLFLNPIYDSLQKLGHQPYGLSEMITKAAGGSMSAITMASAVNAAVRGMDLLMAKPAWQALTEQATRINEPAKPFGAMTAANAFMNPPTGMADAIGIAASMQAHPNLASGISGKLAYLNKIDDQINAFVNPQKGITALIGSISPYEHTLAHKAAITAVAGSLLDMNDYKNLGISAITQSFSVNQLERGYASGMVDMIRAASAFTRMGEENLASFNWTTVGSRYDLPKAIVGPAQTSFLNFTTSYRDLMDSVSAKPNWLYEAPAIAQLPAQEYYTSSQILRLVSDDDVSIEEITAETKQSVAGQSDYLLEYLPRLNNDLPILWHGAVHALKSDNPDRIRHFITSLRELFMHVLHILAPDDAFARWDTTTAHYIDGKPTREGRLRFICRNMDGSNATFAKFMKDDVNSALSLIKMFQKGTHKIKSDLSPKELELIMRRADLFLSTLLKVEFDINRK